MTRLIEFQTTIGRVLIGLEPNIESRTRPLPHHTTASFSYTLHGRPSRGVQSR